MMPICEVHYRKFELQIKQNQHLSMCSPVCVGERLAKNRDLTGKDAAGEHDDGG